MTTTDADVSPSPPAVPFRRPQLIPRRNVLGGLGVGGLSLLLAPTLGVAPAGAAPVGPRPGPLDPRADAANSSGYAPVTPYTVQASCQLTEDYFLTDEVLIDLDGGDQVMPFTTEAGTTEAIVLTGTAGLNKQVAHLAQDPSTTSGWSYTIVDTGLTGLTGATVYGRAGAEPQLMVSGSAGTIPVLAFFALSEQGWSTVRKTAGFPSVLGSGVGPGGQFFYAWNSGGSGSSVELQVTVFDDNNPDGIVVLTQTDKNTTQINDVVVSYDPAGRFGWVVVSATGPGGNYITRSVQTGVSSYGNLTQLATPSLDSLIGVYEDGPQVLWQDTDGVINLSVSGAPLALGETRGSAESSAAAWKNQGLYSFAFCLQDTICMVRQIVPQAPSYVPFTPVIPMLPGVQKVFGLNADPTQSVLFSVGLDASLSVVSYGPTGWTQSVVHQTAASVQEVTSWQCQFTVTDANTIPVPNAAIQLTPDRPVALWQEGQSGGTATPILPGAPFTMTCDSTGQLLVAIPTAELDAAQLIAQALDSSNKASGDALQVSPDTDVQTYLSGTGSLDSVGALTGDALLAAQNTLWDTASQAYVAQGALFTALSQLSGTQRQSAANSVAAAITHITSLPSDVPQLADDVRSACLDLTSAAASFTTSSDPNHFSSSVKGDSSWWDRAKNDVKSAFHGLRHGAIHLQKLVSSWDADAKTWGLNLVVTLGDDVQHLMSFVVHTAEDAVHAISSLVHALGAAIEHFWHWLKNLVLGIFTAAEKGAKVMEAWIEQLDDEMISALDTAENAVDGFFAKLTDKVNGWISDLKTDAGLGTFGSNTPTPAPDKGTGSTNSSINFKDVGEVLKVLQHASPSYWLNKLRKYLPPEPSDGGPDLDLELTSVVTDLITDINAAADTLVAIFNVFSDSFSSIFASNTSMKATQLSKIFDDITTAADDMLTYLDDVADTVIDVLKLGVTVIDDFFTYEFQAVPVIGELLDLAGIDTRLSIQHVACLVATFPTAVVYRAMGYHGDIFPPQTDEDAVQAWADQVRKAISHSRPDTKLGDSFFADPWGASLNLTSAIIQAVWTVNDQSVDAGATTTMTALVDVAAPVVLNILGWPSKPISANLSGWPFRGKFDKSSTDWGILPAIVIAEFAPPGLGLFCLGLQKVASESTYNFFNDTVGPIVSGVSGIVSAVLAGTWSGVNHEGLAVAEAVIGNISYILSFAGLSPWNEEPEVKAAKYIGDLLANSATAGLMIWAFTDAAG